MEVAIWNGGGGWQAVRSWYHGVDSNEKGGGEDEDVVDDRGIKDQDRVILKT